MSPGLRAALTPDTNNMSRGELGQRERDPGNLFEQLDLAPKVTATLLYKQMEFLFIRQFGFSVQPRKF